MSLSKKWLKMVFSFPYGDYTFNFSVTEVFIII